MKAGRKPGSVPQTGRRARRGVIICLGPPLPAASSGSCSRDGEVGQPLSLGLAPGRGLPSRHLSMPLVRSYRTFAPLPDLCSCEAEAEPSAVCFCGTVLTVTRTGRYPAGLAVREPGLSSTGSASAPKARQAPRSRSPHLLSGSIYGRPHGGSEAGIGGTIRAPGPYRQGVWGRGLLPPLRPRGAVAQPDRATVS